MQYSLFHMSSSLYIEINRSSALYVQISKCWEMVLVMSSVSNQCLSFEAKVDANAILPVTV